MELQSKVKIEANRFYENEYLIKDNYNIVLGLFRVTEMDDNKKRCNINLKYYTDPSYGLIRNTLACILKAVFKNKNIFKINIKIKSGLDIMAFLDYGFVLEGILPENEYDKGEFFEEFILGITRYEYENGIKSSNINIRGNDVLIKNLTPSNWKDVLDYYIRNKEHLEPYEPTRDNEFFTEKIQKKLLIENYKQFINGTVINLGIFKKNELIGKIKISNIVYGLIKSGFLGYSIDKDYCGKGYMKESLNLVLKYIFEECDIHRIEASALVINEKSRNVLRRCGFNLLGINERYMFINGEWKDYATYYILKENFYRNRQGE